MKLSQKYIHYRINFTSKAEIIFNERNEIVELNIISKDDMVIDFLYLYDMLLEAAQNIIYNTELPISGGLDRRLYALIKGHEIACLRIEKSIITRKDFK